MNESNKTALVIAFVIVLVLLLLFGGGARTGVTMSGGMMGNDARGGVSWMWFPTLLMAGLGALLVWIIWTKRNEPWLKKKG
jgi:hypothetical protein